MVPVLLNHMHQVGFCQELQVLLQALSQTQIQILIQVELVVTNPLTCHLQSHQWNIMMILDMNQNIYHAQSLSVMPRNLALYHHMYQVRNHTGLQVLYQAVSQLNITPIYCRNIKNLQSSVEYI